MIKVTATRLKKNNVKPVISLVIFLLLLAFVLWAWFFVHNSRRFPVKKVNVSGNYSHIQASKIEDIVEPLVNKSLFSVDIKKIRHELMQLPWVKSAEVERMWPSQLLINLVEKTPLAVWNQRSLITASGDIFSPPLQTFPSALPQFNADVKYKMQVMKNYQAITRILSPLGLYIVQLDLTSDMLWRMKLSNGMDIMIGASQVIDRVQRFVDVYGHVFANKRRAKYIDLRYPNGLAVKWTDN